MLTTTIILLIANAVAHVVSYLKLKQAKAPNVPGVLAFVFVNAAIALLLWLEFDWAIWPALVFPTIGGLGLLTTTLLKGKGIWIDFVILGLDIIIVILALNQL